MTDCKTILRHILATISYRFSKSIDDVDCSFYSFQAPNGVRTPIDIINHMASVLRYLIKEISQREPIKPSGFTEDEEIKLFYDLLREADELLIEAHVPLETCLILIQGPLADILTHVGQISLLRRYFNKPITGENFMKAKIAIGNLARERQDFSNDQFK